MKNLFMRAHLRGLCLVGIVCTVLSLGACSLKSGKGPTEAVPPVGPPRTVANEAADLLEPPAQAASEAADHAAGALEIADLHRIPQDLQWLAAAAGDRLAVAGACREQLLDEFRNSFYKPWSAESTPNGLAEEKKLMRQVGRGNWYGVNKRQVARRHLQELVDNCALENFPSRDDTAVTVAPGHLRGLPSYLPLYEKADGSPFDMLAYPHLKLNEPLRVRHASRDGVWLFVETGYTNGWIEAREVVLVDQLFIEGWMQPPHLVVVEDMAAVSDGRGVGRFRAKIGTILPLARAGEGWWEVRVASAGEGGRAQVRLVRIPRQAAAQFPLAFSPENLALVGNQLLGEPYGWGELYDLRDCSALLRDFFLPFGIWLPRTSADQIASVFPRMELAQLPPPEKDELIRLKGVPFLTLLYKPGHIMLYVGKDAEGRPLVFHSAWSIRVREAGGDRTRIIGASVITSLEPGKELDLVPGSSLLERGTELAVITDRCLESSAHTVGSPPL